MGGTGTGWLRPEMLMAPSTYLHDPARGGGGGEWLEAAYSGGGGRRGEGWELRVNTVLKTWISKLFLEWRPRGWGG